MSGNLKRKAVSGMFWSSIQKFGTMGISFVSNIILARLLSPEDYGCIGMLMIFILVANTFIDGGFGSALIQKKEPTQEDYSTIFYWNLFLSIVLYFVLFGTAPLIARFYNLPLLSSVLRVQGLVLIFNSLSIIQQNRLRKQLLFKKLAIVNIISALLSLAITIYIAYVGWGVWALVAQQLLMSGFNAILYWIVGKWNPNFVFSRQSFKELFGFGGFILLSNLINTFCNNIQGLLIGKFFSPVTMGLYAQARKLEEVASTSFSGVVDQVSYPILSVVQNDKQKMVSAIRKLIMSLAYICFPMMILLILIGDSLIVWLYSDKWIACVPYFRILCVAGMAVCLQGINYYAIAAIGKSRKLFRWTIIKRLTGLFCVILGFYIYDIEGLLWGVVLGAWTIYAMNARLVVKFLGYKYWKQFKDLYPILLLSLLSGIMVYLMNLYVFTNTILQIISFILIYLILSILFKIEAFMLFKSFVIKFASQRK